MEQMLDKLRGLLKQISPDKCLDNDTDIRKLFQNIHYQVYETGMIDSIITDRPVTDSGECLPWYTYAAIQYFNQLDFSDCRILELGSGYSSVYWASRASSVLSVERARDWYEEMRSMNNSENCEILLFEDRVDYFAFLDSVGAEYFDVVIIDGRDRYESLLSVKHALKPGGIIIFDNADWYPESCRSLRAEGFTQIDFSGLGPINNYTWCTSVFLLDAIRIPHKEVVDIPGSRKVIKEDDGHK